MQCVGSVQWELSVCACQVAAHVRPGGEWRGGGSVWAECRQCNQWREASGGRGAGACMPGNFSCTRKKQQGMVVQREAGQLAAGASVWAECSGRQASCDMAAGGECRGGRRAGQVAAQSEWEAGQL
jgi:hypothetical protein